MVRLEAEVKINRTEVLELWSLNNLFRSGSVTLLVDPSTLRIGSHKDFQERGWQWRLCLSPQISLWRVNLVQSHLPPMITRNRWSVKLTTCWPTTQMQRWQAGFLGQRMRRRLQTQTRHSTGRMMYELLYWSSGNLENEFKSHPDLSSVWQMTTIKNRRTKKLYY
jgi:hypothetical protein